MILEPRLITLKLFLDELGIPADIQTVDDRKRVQKAVYLGQLSGVDLGYRYSWYLMGPYCSDLTKDYYSLNEAIKSGDKEDEKMELLDSVRTKLHNILPVLEIPENVKLVQEEWLELLSSLHFLLEKGNYDKEKAIEILKEEKPNLCDFIDEAVQKLSEMKLLH